MKEKIKIPTDKIVAFCRQHHLREFALFGSVLREDFGPDSDIDVLVEFEPDAEIDLIQFSGMRLELIELFGREVDLVTKPALKPLIRNEVLSSREVVYAV